MLIVQFHHAERALKAGRLEEAAAIVARPGVRAHRRGQALVDRLAAALVHRGRRHLESAQPELARLDAMAAERLAGRREDVQSLRRDAAARLRSGQAAMQRAAQRQGVARRLIHAGRLTLAGRLLESDDAADPLMAELEHKQHLAHAASQRLTDAIHARDWRVAAEAWWSLNKLRPDDAAAQRDVLSRGLADAIHANLNAGKLDSATSLSQSLEMISPSHELTAIVRKLRALAEHVTAARVRDAATAAAALASRLPEAPWLQETAQRLADACRSIDAVAAGPLGWMAMEDIQPAPTPPQASRSLPAETPVPTPGRSNLRRLYIDGVAGVLLVLGDRLTLGPVGSGAMMPLRISSGELEICREEEDCFLSTPAGPTLLRDEQKVDLSPRERVMFRRPNPASTTAIIDLTGVRPAESGLRHVVLMGGELLIGPGDRCHLRVPAMSETLTLTCRGEDVMIDGQPLLPGRAVSVDGMNIALV